MFISDSPAKSDYITILAIYDDLSPKPCENTASKLYIPINRSSPIKQRKESSAQPIAQITRKSPSILTRNSNKKSAENCDIHAVHFEDGNNITGTEEDDWIKGNARKSRIADCFMKAKEIIEQQMNEKWMAFDRNFYNIQRIVLSADNCEDQVTPLGLEVSAVPDPADPTKLLAVEVRSIEEKGRVWNDGRLRIGDQIVEINELSCERMSFARARFRLRELSTIPTPSLTFFRRKMPIKSPTNLQRITPVVTALQQGNTVQIGKTQRIYLKKEEDGFGFSFAGRETFPNERMQHLYYVKGLKERCSGSGLAIGDRILQIDNLPLAGITQSEVTSLLKEKNVGESIELLVGKNITDGNTENSENKAKEQHKFKMPNQLWESLSRQFDGIPGLELLCLDVPLNDTPGAGLGLSLKAQRLGATDSGLYIRSILHGSAAFKDGRLHVNDRLVGVEDRNLLAYEFNGEALEAFMRTISQLPQSSRSIRLFVVRKQQTAQTSMNNCPVRWGSDSDISQLSSFDREANTRRSISEKRPMGTRKDPPHSQSCQQIIHQRQVSAPALPSLLVSDTTRARRSFHHESCKTRHANIAIEKSKQRPNTVFYTDEKGTDITDMATSATFPRSFHSPNSPIETNKTLNCVDSVSDAMPPTIVSHPSSFPTFVRNNAKDPRQHNQCGSKQSKHRRSSFGNGLLKFFGRTSSGKERTLSSRENESQTSADMHPELSPHPPPYRVLHPIPCSSANFVQNCSSCTSSVHPHQLVHHHHSVRAIPTSTPSPPCQQHMFHSPNFGLVGVPQPQDDSACPGQKRHRPLISYVHMAPQPQRTTASHNQLHHQHPLLPQAWTTMTRSMPGSLPGPPHHAFSDASDSHRGRDQQSRFFSRMESKMGKSKPSAIFYDFGSDWVIRC